MFFLLLLFDKVVFKNKKAFLRFLLSFFKYVLTDDVPFDVLLNNCKTVGTEQWVPKEAFLTVSYTEKTMCDFVHPITNMISTIWGEKTAGREGLI